jgi:hypothetical protein
VIIERYKVRYWAVRDNHGTLICVTVYKRGAEEVVDVLRMVLQLLGHVLRLLKVLISQR